MKWITIIICVLVISAGYARQTAPETEANDLNKQYHTLSSDCDLIDGFRMVKLYRMDQLWKVVQDSIQRSRSELHQSKVLVSSQKAEIQNLKTSLTKVEGEKSVLNEAVDNMTVFGNTISKTSVITWGVIVFVSLAVLLGIAAVMYRASFSNAREFRKLYESLNQEFEDYKHKSVEKQIKLSRELQNYRNRAQEVKTI